MYDRKFISDLYDLHASDLFVYIYSYLKSREAAEDVLHDVFVKLMHYSERRMLHRRNPRALLYTIARTLSIDYLRKNRRVIDTPVEETMTAGDPVSEDYEKKEIRQRVEESLDRMKHSTRSVFIMRTELQMAYSDIAHTLGISERTAKREMQRALAIISGELERVGYIEFILTALAFFLQGIVY